MDTLPGSEKNLFEILESRLKDDFFIHKEISGIHKITNKKVRIDAILYPKEHVIESGLDAGYIGIELKILPIDDEAESFAKKTARAFWQAITYQESSFELFGTRKDLIFSLLFTNLDFSLSGGKPKDYPYRFHESIGSKFALMNSLAMLANHGHVGRLSFECHPKKQDDWSICFAGSPYFRRKTHFNAESELVTFSPP